MINCRPTTVLVSYVTAKSDDNLYFGEEAKTPETAEIPEEGGSTVLKVVLYGLVFAVSVGLTAKVSSARLRTILLALISYILYLSWSSWWFLALLLFSTVANSLCGKWLRKSQSRMALAFGLLFNLTLLGSFKYLPPLALSLPVASLQRFSHLLLPLGISFWTFQAMSYLFDLYRGEELDPSFSEFLLYMAFFPTVVSGPISRMPDMLPQFRSGRCTKWSDIGCGLRRIATGVLMLLLARLLGQGLLPGEGVDSGFDRLTQWSGTDVWCLAFGFGLQLFFDFAGYSHVVIGAAQALGFELPENFDHPFSSTTPSIFWTRWHMSLSFWIRDYVFLPLAVLRREVWWRNLMLVAAMVLFGIWHKATLLFVIWGCYHGMLLLLHRQVQWTERRFDWNPPEHLWNPLSWIVSMSLINLGWIFFRAGSIDQAAAMLRAVMSLDSYRSHVLSGSIYIMVIGLAIAYAITVGADDWLKRKYEDRSEFETKDRGLIRIIAVNRWYWIPALYALVLLLVLMATLNQSGGTAQLMYRSF